MGVKLQSLDINTWSLIVFISNALTLIAVLVLFSKPFIRAALITGFLWITSQILFTLYGYYTDQVGFLLLGIFNIVVSIIAAVMKVGEDEEVNEDQ